MQDMIKKNRQYRPEGELHKMTTFLYDDIKEIRRLYEEEKLNQMQIAMKYGKSLTCIHNIVNRKTWKHI